ncbi:MAG TPA: hypothetical protein VGL77_09140 [Armatimonadota bacterium]|jgi:hypothetical protein
MIYRIFGVLTLVCLFVCAMARAEDAVSPRLQAAFARAKTERVAVIGIGDSNQRFGGHGWSRYMAQSLTERFGAYGTGLQFMRTPPAEAGQPAVEIPAELKDKAYGGWYLAEGAHVKPDWRQGSSLYLVGTDLMDVTGPLRFHLIYGTFPAGTGAFQPMVRRGTPPWTPLLSEKVSPAPGAYGFAEHVLTLPADATRTWNLHYGVTPVNEEVVGPFYGVCQWAENTAKTSGLSYQTLYAAGGQSLYDMLKTFNGYLPAQLTDYFVQVRASLNGSKTCVVMISSGLNDRNERELSIGPKGGLVGDSKEAFGDNLLGIFRVLQDAWVRAGGTASTIHFAVMPSHPQSDPDDAELVSYLQAARDVTASVPNASVIQLSALVSYQDMVEKKMYDKGVASSPHLSPVGYETLSRAVANALAP